MPVVGGSAFKNKGVQFLIDAVIDYLPGPLDIPPAQGTNPNDHSQKVDAPADDNAKFCSLAFKLWTDPFVGKLVFFRVYSGSLSKGTTVYNPRTNKRERISRLVQIHADKRDELETVYAGDIAAIVGIKDVKTGDTLCIEDFDIQLEPPSFPEPVISMAIEPKTKGDREKMGEALGRLVEEDPTLTVKTNEETGQTIIAGMGELHLDIIMDRMRREFNVETNAGAPQIAYRESITKSAEGEGKLVKQSGGRGQYGHGRPGHDPRRNAARASSSRTRSSAATFRRNTFPPAARALRKRCSTASSTARPSSTWRSTSPTVPTTKSTPTNSRSSSPPSSPSRTP